MSTSLLYHAFNLKGVVYQSTHFMGNTVILSAEMTDKFIKCPICGGKEATYKGQNVRWLRMSPIGRKQCLLRLFRHRLKCFDCGKIWLQQLPFMEGNHRYTRSFTQTTLDLLRFGTIRSVAHYLGVGWDLIKEIHKSKLHQLYRKISLSEVKYLGIDEFSIRKGHNYMTIFTDIRKGRILHAVEGRSKEVVLPFLKHLARKAKKLKAVAMDMSRSYFWAVTEAMPDVKVVFDRFHIMAMMNKAIDELRRTYHAQLDTSDQKILKGSRFLFLRNYESLNLHQQNRLDTLMDINEPLFLVHSMKEQLRLFWELKSRESSERFLSKWCDDAFQTGLKPLIRVAKTLSSYRVGILNYFDHKITSGSVEGTVNKIKNMKRQAYGFRDIEYFKLRLYHLHTQRYSVTG